MKKKKKAALRIICIVVAIAFVAGCVVLPLVLGG